MTVLKAVRIEEEIWKELKLLAVEKGLKLEAMIELLIKEHKTIKT